MSNSSSSFLVLQKIQDLHRSHFHHPQGRPREDRPRPGTGRGLGTGVRGLGGLVGAAVRVADPVPPRAAVLRVPRLLQGMDEFGWEFG